GPMSDVLGAITAARLGEFPVLTPDARSYWYRLVWDLGFAGGWPWDRVESARAAGRRLVRIPPSMRDAVVAALAEATSRLRRRPRHVVVKSVNSVFSLDWIVRRYTPKVLVLRRNPLNVVSSWVVLNLGTERRVGDHPHVHETYVRPLGLVAPNGASSSVRMAAWHGRPPRLALYSRPSTSANGARRRHTENRLACLVTHVRAELIEGPDTAARARHNAGVAQLGEVVADRRLAELEGGGEVADANRFG